jgi:DNA-binding CsgD family transcriptional regulator
MGDALDLLEREEPRGRLEAALASARRGQGRVVSVEGEAGIGKTSLVLSFVDAHRGDARVWMGGCEQLTTPEPLGPLRDIARESQGRFAVSGAGPLATYEALLRLLTGGRGPALLVIEDIHWADDATLDLLRYLGRRIRAAPVLVLASFRHDEPASQGRLAQVWSDMPRDTRERIELSPLTLAAVETLAQPAGGSAAAVFQATGGNPFHVTEYLASGGEGVPRSVQEATLSRADRLSPRARRTLDGASLFPRRIDESTLRVIADDPDLAGVEECLRVGMLEARDGQLAFRHELARRAVRDAISPLRARELHAQALALLKTRNDARAAETAHHAEQAGETEDLVEYSIRAADEAAQLGAHREAVAHLEKALAHGTLSPTRRADLLERQAQAGEACGAFETAMAAIEHAIAIRRRAGEPLALGDALRIASRLHWQCGQAQLGEACADEALAILRRHENGPQFAMALAATAQLHMVAGRHAPCIAVGTEALDRAEALGRDDIYLHALTSVVTARCYTDLAGGLPQLWAAVDEAHRRGQPDALPRLYTCITYMSAHDRRYDGLPAILQAGIEAAEARENAPLAAYMRGVAATALFDQGRLEEAVAEAEGVLHGPYPRGITLFPTLAVLSRARVRLGRPEGGLLEQARALPPDRKDLMRIVPLALADAEAHWLGETRPDALANLRDAYANLLEDWTELWSFGDVLLWLTVLGEAGPWPEAVLAELSPEHRLHAEGRWREAADAWAKKGCPYEQALALSAGGEADQREALAIFDALGAAPAAGKLRRDLRAAGVRSVPVGPRSARKADSAGLTRRQGEVLELLGEGLSNAEIAERLKTSPKTVEHHVGAILAAFDAPSRLRAVQIAREQGRLP